MAAASLLILNGDDINAANIFGWTPLHKGMITQIYDTCCKSVKFHRCTFFSFIPTLKASQSGRLDIVELLIENGAKKNVRLPNGLTAEEIAKEYGN